VLQLHDRVARMEEARVVKQLGLLLHQLQEARVGHAIACGWARARACVAAEPASRRATVGCGCPLVVWQLQLQVQVRLGELR